MDCRKYRSCKCEVDPANRGRREPIEGAVILDRTHTDSLIVFDGSLVAGEVTAQGLHAESDLLGIGVALKKGVSLQTLKSMVTLI
jgi:hypothetical protein